MAKNSHVGVRSELLQKKEELTARLKRITDKTDESLIVTVFAFNSNT